MLGRDAPIVSLIGRRVGGRQPVALHGDGGIVTGLGLVLSDGVGNDGIDEGLVRLTAAERYLLLLQLEQALSEACECQGLGDVSEGEATNLEDEVAQELLVIITRLGETSELLRGVGHDLNEELLASAKYTETALVDGVREGTKEHA